MAETWAEQKAREVIEKRKLAAKYFTEIVEKIKREISDYNKGIGKEEFVIQDEQEDAFTFSYVEVSTTVLSLHAADGDIEYLKNAVTRIPKPTVAITNHLILPNAKGLTSELWPHTETKSVETAARFILECAMEKK